MYGIELRIKIPGAKFEENERSEAAPWAVFEEGGVNPWAFAAGAFTPNTLMREVSHKRGDTALSSEFGNWQSESYR